MAGIIDMALQNELDGRQFYLAQAAKTTDEQTKQLFVSLAEDEARHHQAILQLQEGKPPQLAGRDAQVVARSIFAPQTLSEEELQEKQSMIEAYEMAIRFEEKSIETYSTWATNTQDAGQRQLCQELIKEETAHRKVLWRLLELLRSPEDWYPYLQF